MKLFEIQSPSHIRYMAWHKMGDLYSKSISLNVVASISLESDLVVPDVLHLAGEGDVVAHPDRVVGQRLEKVRAGLLGVSECGVARPAWRVKLHPQLAEGSFLLLLSLARVWPEMRMRVRRTA